MREEENISMTSKIRFYLSYQKIKKKQIKDTKINFI